jgi:hypothetical protein
VAHCQARAVQSKCREQRAVSRCCASVPAERPVWGSLAGTKRPRPMLRVSNEPSGPPAMEAAANAGHAQEARKLQYQIPHAGMSRTGDQIRSSIKTLEGSLPEPVIFYCLRDAGDPLAALVVPPKERWWWAFAGEEEKQHGPPPMLEKYQDRKHPPVTKCLVIAGLRRMIDGDGDAQAAPGTDVDAHVIEQGCCSGY